MSVFYVAWLVLTILVAVDSSLVGNNDLDAIYCVIQGIRVLWFGLMLPVIVYKTLVKDAEYWEGIIEDSFGVGSIRKTPSEANIRTPLLGITFDQSTARTLADEMGNLDSACEVINYAHLEMPKQKHSQASVLLGAGGTGRVFRGRYRKREVAIKMLYCVTLEPETVQNFFRESALLSRLRHPNIVHLEGICVLPPSICMVLELCRFVHCHRVLRDVIRFLYPAR